MSAIGDNETVAREAVDRLVRSGFYSADEIVEYINEELFWNNEIELGWLHFEIARAFQRKVEDEKSWPEVTDCDRLDAVFDELEADNILSVQNAGYTQQNAIDDVAQYSREAGGEESDYEGFCFYHGQDLERVIDGGELAIGFGDVDGDDAKGEEIGRRIKSFFEVAGFEVDWNGSIQTRLSVKGIHWQRRFRPEG